MHASIDGEAVTLRPRLEFVVVLSALRVRISSDHPGVSPSGLVTLTRAGARRELVEVLAKSASGWRAPE